MEDNILLEIDKKRIKLLEDQLASKSDEIEHLKKQLLSKERIFEKSERINQELRDQIHSLSVKLQSYDKNGKLPNKRPRVLHSSSQTDLYNKLLASECDKQSSSHNQLSDSTTSLSPPLLSKASLESLVVDRRIILSGGQSKLSSSIESNSTSIKKISNDTNSRQGEEDLTIASTNNEATNSWQKESDNTQTRISELIRNCVNQSISSASDAIQEDDYIYDDKSRTYYSPSTQLYWYPDSSFFYDPRSSSYYHYDSARKSLQFHSTFKLSPEPTISEKDDITIAEIVANPIRHTNNPPGESSSLIKHSVTNHKAPTEDSVKNKSAESVHKTFAIEGHTNNEQIEGIRGENSSPSMLRVSESSSDTNMKQGRGFACIENNQKSELLTSSSVNPVSDLAKDLEEGEISDSDSLGDPYNCREVNQLDDTFNDTDYLSSTRYRGPENLETLIDDLNPDSGPSCIRMIVKKSQSLEIGSLLLVSPLGGTLGLLPECHVCIPDAGIEQRHCMIYYDKSLRGYYLKDLVLNGTISLSYDNGLEFCDGDNLNSSAIALNHAYVLKLGLDTQLIIHIHPGRDVTCNDCEPGIVQRRLKEESKLRDKGNSAMNLLSGDKETDRRSALNAIKRKYGLKSSSMFDDKAEEVLETNSSDQDQRVDYKKQHYRDRAAERRATRIGTDNPYEKTDLTVGQKALGPKNKGYKLLNKMGWCEGQRLGTDPSNECNLLEPILILDPFAPKPLLPNLL